MLIAGRIHSILCLKEQHRSCNLFFPNPLAYRVSVANFFFYARSSEWIGMLGLFYLLDTLHRVIIIGRGYVCTSRKVWNWRRSGNESVQIENRRKRRRKRRGLEKFLDETCQRAYPEETSIHSFGLCGFTRLPTLRPARVYLRCPARPPSARVCIL